MGAWWALRLVTWAGFAAWSAGAIGAVGEGPLATRRQWVYRWATPGFVLLWVAGWGLARASGVSLGAPWITVAMVASLLQLQGMVWAVAREGRGAGWVRVAVGVLFAATVLAMTLRPGGA